jgi:hypothetical protein
VRFLTASWHTVPYFLGSDSVSLLFRGAVPTRAVAFKAAGTAVADSTALATGDAISVTADGLPALVRQDRAELRTNFWH